MPTGYTAKIQDGSITEFRDFAWQCARAFGALIEMRDDPMDAPIPEAFAADTKYYDLMIEDAERRLAELSAITPELADKEAAAAHQDALKGWNERKAERDRYRLRYLTMIEKVKAWQPPSADHLPMKQFMIEQLESSMKFDCVGYENAPEPKTGTQWLQAEEASATRSASYGRSERAKELARVKDRNKWVSQLRESLNNC